MLGRIFHREPASSTLWSGTIDRHELRLCLSLQGELLVEEISLSCYRRLYTGRDPEQAIYVIRTEVVRTCRDGSAPELPNLEDVRKAFLGTGL